MAEPAKKTSQPDAANDLNSGRGPGSATTHIKNTHTDELVIALCGPIGSPLHDVAKELQTKLVDTYKYDKCEIIRPSDIIKEYKGADIDTSSKFEEIKTLISAGNALRQSNGPSILAELAIKKISLDREEEAHKKGHEAPKPRRVCHIIDSIKNQEELDILQVIYREMLNFVGVFSPLEARIKSLNEKGLSTPQIHHLIDQDSGEELDHGQTVRGTFPLSDFFLRVDNSTRSKLNEKVDRYLDLILGTRIITPTTSETAMYMAASAATNSACLSRQVGAALTDSRGDLLSVGWNDVPKFEGGLYGFDPINDPTSADDHRCWNSPGKCSNDSEKNIIANEVANTLLKNGLIESDKKEQVASALRNQSKLKGLIEFSRAVHAEMHAIISAGDKAGERIRGGKLYCTTYPCHSCARHIIAAGIGKVYYIEPYRKSLATKLHGDAITEDENKTDMVRILPYEGVAPAKYLQLFRMQGSRKEKENGKVKVCKRGAAKPRVTKTLEALSALEGVVVDGLASKEMLEAGGAE